MNLIPDQLKSRLARRQCVAFVGAGFSMPCGMPNWSVLLKMLLEDAKAAQTHKSQDEILRTCKKTIADKQYSLAVSLIKEVMNSNDLDEAIRNKFGMNIYRQAPNDVKIRMQERMKNLMMTAWSGIVTTNYDELIEYGIGRYNNRELTQAFGNDPSLGSILCSTSFSGFFFVKLHGSVNGGNYVLGTEEYDRTYVNTPQVTSFLISLMMRYNIVFIGCSLEDEILRIRRKLCHDFNGRIPAAYALLPANEHNNARRSWLKQQAQIESILYCSKITGYPAHSAVDLFLDEAARCTDSFIDLSDGEDTASLLKQQTIKERLSKIGALNLELIKIFLYENPNHEVRHLQLLNPDLLSHVDAAQAVLEISPDERIYRIFFLESLDLLQTVRNPDGSRSYKLNHNVATELKL